MRRGGGVHHLQYFLNKLSISWENMKFQRHFLEGHHVQMFSEAAELCWKTDHLTKSLSCFIVRSHVGVKCVIYCASFWRVHNLGDRARCVKNEGRKRETWTKREELEVKKCMRRDFCARRERGVRKIVIWHPRWVNMRIEFGNFVTHQDGFLVNSDDDCSDGDK